MPAPPLAIGTWAIVLLAIAAVLLVLALLARIFLRSRAGRAGGVLAQDLSDLTTGATPPAPASLPADVHRGEPSAGGSGAGPPLPVPAPADAPWPAAPEPAPSVPASGDAEQDASAPPAAATEPPRPAAAPDMSEWGASEADAAADDEWLPSPVAEPPPPPAPAAEAVSASPAPAAPPADSPAVVVPPATEPQPPVEPRYANVRVAGRDGGRPARIQPAGTFMLLVDIGALRADSDVHTPQPFPTDLLPAEDLEITVLVSSADFKVRPAQEDGDWVGAAAGTLVLPADGRQAHLPESDATELRFELKAPEAHEPPPTGQVSYLYRNTIVQSQRIVLRFAAADDGWLVVEADIDTDFTLSERLADDLAPIRSRQRIVVLGNEGSAGSQQVTVQVAAADGAALQKPLAYAVPTERLEATVRTLRKRLTDDSPTQPKRSKDDLVRDLRDLAPLGWDLCNVLEAGIVEAVQEHATSPQAVVQVVLPRGSSFTVPWAFVYDIALDSSTDIRQVPVCEVVEHLDQVTPDTRACPFADSADHYAGLLCPFGLWGFRYEFELLTSADAPRVQLHFPRASRIVIGETRQIGARQLRQHVDTLGDIVRAIVPSADLRRAADKQQLKREIEPDLPILYLLCHGDRVKNTTVLSVGDRDGITASDLNGWIMEARRARGRRMWTTPTPLVFLNACGSLAIEPSDLSDYVTSFVRNAHAVGLIGTEARVEPGQAMAFAERFFGRLLTDRATIGDAISQTRAEQLSQANLLGLYYTSYGFADLHPTVET